MKIKPSICPECGETVNGTCDQVASTCLLDQDDDGNFDFSGESEMHWDTSTTETNDKGQWLVCCENGHEWWAAVEE
jgi:hypothetical protein